MSDFFNDYLNIKKIMESKREYKKQINRVNDLPEDYQYVFKKIQHYMWRFATGCGYDMMHIHADLLELFEAGAANSKHVLEITGQDVAEFCDELLRNAETSTENWRDRFNQDIIHKVRK